MYKLDIDESAINQLVLSKLRMEYGVLQSEIEGMDDVREMEEKAFTLFMIMKTIRYFEEKTV